MIFTYEIFHTFDKRRFKCNQCKDTGMWIGPNGSFGICDCKLPELIKQAAEDIRHLKPYIDAGYTFDDFGRPIPPKDSIDDLGN